MKNDILREKTFLFAIRMVKLFKFLTDERKEFIMSKQLMRCGTNPGAMVREAANAETGQDFVHKLGIAQKEIAEATYWIELLHATDYLNEAEFKSLCTDSEEIMKLIRSSIITKKKNMLLKK